MDASKRNEFSRLFAQAVEEYINTPDGQEHLAQYARGRDEAKRNLDDILARRERGEDVTDLVLLKLLPYSDSERNRQAGAWVHIAPAVTGNLKLWYERARRTKPGDWPHVAEAILDFVVCCVERPEELAEACEAFAASPYSKGFQTGMLSPILNALRPEAFRIINNKTLTVYGYLVGTKHGPSLVEYPTSNAMARELSYALEKEMRRQALPSDARLDDALDLFCHWLVSIHEYEFERQFTRLEHSQVHALMAEVLRVFPDWSGVDDPRFVHHETSYKRVAVEKAQELLSEEELRNLIAAQEYDEVIGRLQTVGRATNLLYQSQPSRGDLNILYDESLDKPTFCQAIQDLLHGEGPSEERLARYLAYVEEHNLPTKWTFSTYFLFLSHPESEMFVKPYTTRWFLQFLDMGDEWEWRPSPRVYAIVKELSADILAAFRPYGVKDMVDVQSIIWTGYSYKDEVVEDGWDELPQHHVIKDASDTLAPPFDAIFADREEAEWAFDLMRQTLERLEISDATDARFRVSLRRASRGGMRLRLIYANLVLLEFRGPQSAEKRVEISLLAEYAEELEQYLLYDYRVAEGQPDVNLYHVPIKLAQELVSSSMDTYLETLDVIRDSFGHWRRSPMLGRPQPELARAVFSDEERDRLLAEGLEPEPMVEGYFSEETFELLAGLRTSPTRVHYLEHKEAFVEHLETPFQELFANVVLQLPKPVTDLMETEKNVFGRILKNDFGRGGAWEHYWGALFPKGGKRIEDVQLFIWMNCDEIRFGLAIGNYGTESRQRFTRNLANYGSTIARTLDESLSGVEGLYIGRDASEAASFADWVRMPQVEPEAGVYLEREQALSLNKDQLSQQIAFVFTSLFPLALLVQLDDPLPAILSYLGEEDDEVEIQPEHTLEKCAQATSFAVEELKAWVEAIHRKGQAVLYGPPGTGKTFVAEELARHLVGGGDGFWEMVQFHPSYAYEDFVQGIRPQRAEGGGLDYPVLPGRFVTFCLDAAQRTGTCVLIIDEVNRANLSRVFGELMCLLEYRDKQVRLAVNGRRFHIPSNVRLLGTMNTADRSIALVDHALRRRFAFIRLDPMYEVLHKWHNEKGTGFDPTGLVAVLNRLNERINDAHYAIGISFFLVDAPDKALPSIWRMEIEPYLEEYFFDRSGIVDEFRWRRVEKDVFGT